MSWQNQAAAAPGSAERAGAPPGAADEASSADDDEALSAAAVQARTGLSPRTLRYYEELGLLPDVRRRAGGRRVYGAAELERLRFISRLKTLGLSLAEIKELNAVYAIGGSTRAMLRRLAELLDRHRAELDARIAELSALRAEIHRYRAPRARPGSAS